MKSLNRVRKGQRKRLLLWPLFYWALLSSQCQGQTTTVPDCAGISALIKLPEDTAPGSLIMNTTVNLLALRTDTSSDSGMIEIANTTQGLGVRLIRQLDAENMNLYNVFPVFCANTDTDRSTVTEIRIIIEDVNEFDPLFQSPGYGLSLPETTSLHSTVFTFNNQQNQAYDPDLSHDSIGYSIVNDKADNPFYITPEGDLVLNRSLDFESGQTSFALEIEAKEQGTAEHRSSQVILSISVEDSDDENPVFGSSFYTLTLPEGVYDGSKPYATSPQISAVDGDASINQPIVYTIDPSSEVLYRNLFSITSTGALTILGDLSIGSYSVNIRASQTDKPSVRYSIAVAVINVTDVNDHAPVMGYPAYDVIISEGVRPGFTILTVTAHDADLGDNAVFHFELDDPSQTFTVTTSGKQGEISLVRPVDREARDYYAFEVWAVENKTQPSLRSPASQVTVKVIDKNDNSPKFRQDSYLFDVKRTATEGYKLGQVIADDEDLGLNGLVVYHLQPLPAWDAFTVGNDSGILELVRDLGLDDVGTYIATVVASDLSVSEPRSSATQVTIHVVAVNDHAPVFVSPAEPVVLNISETVMPGTSLITVRAEDLDGDPIQYFLRPDGNNDGRFRLDSMTGEITLVAPVDLDSEVASAPVAPLTVELLVEAKDDLVHATLLAVTVNIEYVNEFAPVFDTTSTVDVFENATLNHRIATVSATDKDSGPDGKLTYSLLASDVPAGMFKINPDSGVITLACPNCLDFNAKSTYTLIIKAEDGGSPPRLALTTLPVQVTETVLVPPHFLQSQYQVDWQENRLPGFLLQLEAEDPDTDPARLTYTLSGRPVPSDVETKIKVYSNGTVYTTEPFDAEQISHFSADVKVSDGNSEAFAKLSVSITDVNDEDPVLNVTDSSIFNVPENASIGAVVTTVGASDADVTNDGFTFWLDSSGLGKFSLDQTSGVLTVAGQLDRRVATSYNLTVHVSDYGAPPRFAQATVTVDIEDSNTGPLFLDTSGVRTSQFDFNVTEDAPVGELLGVLRAFDPDSGSSGDLSYTIISGDPNHKFSLDSTTGNLSLAGSLNYEQTPSYSLKATVTDNSFVPASDTAELNIRVINVVEAPRWPLPLPVVYLTQTSACAPRLRAFSRELTSVSSQGDEVIEYKLVNQTGEFSINSTSGLLQTNNTLEAREYVLALLACSRGTDVCSTANLVVVVRSDDILAFCPAFYRVEISETSPLNYTVEDLPTSKSDSDVLYEITDGNEAGKFGIESGTGRVFLKGSLDRETTDQFTLIVSATLRNSPSETAQAQVIVAVSDSPDSPPEFSARAFTGEVTEEVAPVSPVYIPGTSLNLVLTATDADENPQLTYTIEESTDTSNGSFSVDSKGQLFLIKLINFETMDYSLDGTFSFNVSVSDGYFNATVPVAVVVKDINDNWPMFVTDDDLEVNVTEDGDVPRSVLSILATDTDLVDQGKLEYSLTVVDPPGTSSPFSVDGRTGMVRLERQVDREEISSYTINLTVTDSDPSHRVTQKVLITVTDLNDNSPVFENSSYSMEVEEGGGGIGESLTLRVSDADIGSNAQLTYTFDVTSGDVRIASSFGLSRTEHGVRLYTIRGLDRETHRVIPLTITARDNGDPRKTGQCSVVVTVTDINDNSPEFDLAGQTLYRATVRENSLNNTVISVNPPISVRDADEGENGESGIVFTLHPATQQMMDIPFTVDDVSRQLVVRYTSDGQLLDREDTDSYQLKIVATDEFGQGLNATASLSITIADEDDVAPRFTAAGYSFRIPENADIGTEVGVVLAEDDDLIESLVVYGLEGSRLFSIHPFNGAIRVAGSLDRETSSSHVLTVSACDLNGCDYKNVTVKVTDINDNCPAWNGTTLTFHVVEDQGAGSYLGDLQASDPDLGENGQVEFFLNDTVAPRYIEVSQAGHVTLKTHVDDSDLPSQQNFLTFPVYATDRGVPPCATIGGLKIIVSGVNDNPPEICFKGVCGVDEIELSVLDKSEADTVIGQVKARDIDTGSDGEVTFSFWPDTDGVAELFNISSTGIITLAQKINLGDLRQNGQLGDLSAETNATLVVILVAIDKGSNSKSSNATLLLTIVSSTTDAPLFSKFSYEMTIPENEAGGSSVGTVVATSPRGSQLTYSVPVEEHTKPFTVEPLTGKIVTTTELNRETQALYQFVVSAVDPFLPAFPASAVVTVRVTDMNDNKPVFVRSYISVDVLENDDTQPILTTLTARDADIGKNGEIQYRLVGDQISTLFSVNDTSGELTLLHPLDRETNAEFDLTVQASDGGGLTADAIVHIQVLDDNDHWPDFTKSVYETVVIRSSSIRQTVAQVQARDGDTGPNAQVVYTLALSEDSQTFIIDYLTGEIDSIAPLPKDSYNLVVLAADQGQPPRVSNASVLITVEDNNTDVISALTLSSFYVSLFVGMAQGTQLPLNMTTVNAAKFSISAGNEEGWFDLTPEGHIILQNNITEVAVFELTLTATSITGHEASQQVQVAFLPLSFDQPDYIDSVIENGTAPVDLLDLSSYPETLGIPVVYSLSKHSGIDIFRIDATTGVLTLLKPLDREAKSIHVLDIGLRLLAGYDGASSVTATVVIRVKDKNDNVPSFGSSSPILRLDVPDNVTVPWTLATLTAFDPDEGLNGLIAYTISEGDTTSFSISRDTGELQLVDSSHFNKQDASMSRLTVVAVDRNGTGKAASLDVEVHTVRQTYQFPMLAPISPSTFINNQNSIVRQLNDILGLRLVVDDVLVHSGSNGLDLDRADVLIHAVDPRTNSLVPVDTVQRKLTQHEAEISTVFESYMDEVTVRKSPSDDEMSAAAIALIVIGCIMFLVSLICIIVVVLLWKRQKAYAEREETAVRARQRVEERLARQKESNKATTSSTLSDDPDQDFEMDIDLDFKSLFDPKKLLRQTAESSGDMISSSRGGGPSPSELGVQDTRMFFFEPESRTKDKGPSRHLERHRSHDSLHLYVHSRSGIEGVIGASSIDSGIDYTGDGDGSKEFTDTTPRPQNVIPGPRETTQIEGGVFSGCPTNQRNSESNNAKNKVNNRDEETRFGETGKEGKRIHAHASTGSSSATASTSQTKVQMVVLEEVDIDKAQGHVELQFVNPTFTTIADHDPDCTDILTRL